MTESTAFSFLAVLDAGGAVITSNDTLSRELQIRYALYRRGRGDAVWTRPRIQSFRRYTIESWEACWPDRQLLSPVQELALFKSVIDRSDDGRRMISSTSTARTARRASALVRAYRLDPRHPSFAGSDETRSFQRWHQAVEERLASMGWTTPDAVVEELIELIDRGRASVPARVLVTGFTRFTPQQEAFWASLRARGVVVEMDSLPQPASGRFLRPVDEVAEARVCALHIHELLQESRRSGHPPPRIGVFVEDLETAREVIEPVFTEVLAPQKVVPRTDPLPLPWRYSRGQSLDVQELVHAALTALALQLHDNDSDLVTRFLLGKRFGDGPEFYVRAGLDLALRRQGGRRIGLKQVMALAEAGDDTHAPRFAERLRGLILDLVEQNDRALPSTWAERYRRRLRFLAWPGDAADSESEQILHGWEESLRLFAAMDRQLGAVDSDRAYAWLRELAATREHNPHSRYSQPVQVMSWGEATGMQFDVAIALGASAARLPARASPNPFLPLELQLQADLPGASPERALADGRSIVRAIGAAAREVIWSCPAHAQDGTRITPSPLLGGWPAAAPSSLQTVTVLERILDEGIQTSIPADDPVPAVVDPQADGIHGGVAIIASFTAMPFYAFARHRLGIEPFPMPEAGLNAAEQGRVVHAALEWFWSMTRTRAALRALDNGQLIERIDRAIRYATEGKGCLPEWRYGRHLAAMERRRLAQVLNAWLETERQRSEEFTVLAVEHASNTVVAGLPIAVRLDRIDRVDTDEGDRVLVIDYKTGRSANPLGWQPDILTEPQLPLYASCVDLGELKVSGVDGIAFAHVSEGECRFHARTRWAAYLVPVENGRGAPVTWWDKLCDEWRCGIEDAARRFLAGDARAHYEETPARPYADLMIHLRPDVQR